MIISDKFVFIHNCHCGGSSIRNGILPHTFNLIHNFPLSSCYWHKPVRILYDETNLKHDNIPSLLQYSNLPKFGLTRNPWDWYVSLFHHSLPNGPFMKTYSPNREFHEFVTNLLSDDYNNNLGDMVFAPPGDPITPHKINKPRILSETGMGLFTFRNIYTFIIEYPSIINDKKYPTDIQFDVDVYKLEGGIVEMITEFCNSHNIPIKFDIPHAHRNSTGHKKYVEYYTDHLVDLVATKDRFIINKFGYKFGE